MGPFFNIFLKSQETTKWQNSKEARQQQEKNVSNLTANIAEVSVKDIRSQSNERGFLLYFGRIVKEK
jgi:hypothetical protein